MKPISVCVLALVALAVATPYPSDSEEAPQDAKVIIHTTPTQVTVTGAVPIPIAEVLKAAKAAEEAKAVEETPVADDREDMVGEEKKIEKRWGKKEEEGHGWLPSLPSLFGWGSSPPAPTTAAPAIVGPFAFQLGAYYNPLIPAVLESNNRYPASSRPAYNPSNTYAPSPSYSNPSSYTPASGASSSYSAPSSYSSSSPSSYSAPSTYSSPSSYTPSSSSYPSSSYTPQASYSPPSSSYSSYSAPSSYSSPATYGNPPY